MQKKKRVIEGVLVIAFVTIALLSFWVQKQGAASQPLTKVIPTIRVLDDPDKKTSDFAGDFGKAPFDHVQHEKFKQFTPQDKCVVCHHTNKDTLVRNADGSASDEVEKCATCHKAEDSPCELDRVTVGTTNNVKNTKGL